MPGSEGAVRGRGSGRRTTARRPGDRRVRGMGVWSAWIVSRSSSREPDSRCGRNRDRERTLSKMRDPNRIPLVLAAIERRSREQPDLRLGQLLNVVAGTRQLSLIEDGTLLELLGPETMEERRYIATEPLARRNAWRRFL